MALWIFYCSSENHVQRFPDEQNVSESDLTHKIAITGRSPKFQDPPLVISELKAQELRFYRRISFQFRSRQQLAKHIL